MVYRDHHTVEVPLPPPPPLPPSPSLSPCPFFFHLLKMAPHAMGLYQYSDWLSVERRSADLHKGPLIHWRARNARTCYKINPASKIQEQFHLASSHGATPLASTCYSQSTTVAAVEDKLEPATPSPHSTMPGEKVRSHISPEISKCITSSGIYPLIFAAIEKQIVHTSNKGFSWVLRQIIISILNTGVLLHTFFGVNIEHQNVEFLQTTLLENMIEGRPSPTTSQAGSNFLHLLGYMCMLASFQTTSFSGSGLGTRLAYSTGSSYVATGHVLLQGSGFPFCNVTRVLWPCESCPVGRTGTQSTAHEVIPNPSLLPETSIVISQ